MRNILGLVLLVLLVAGAGCKKSLFETNYNSCQGGYTSNPIHPLKDSVQLIIDKYINAGIPGAQVTIHNGDGWAFITGGFAKIESKQKAKPCDANWLFSLTKTYTAVLTLQLRDQGLVNLDHKISEYVGDDILQHLQGNENVTVRMLLNHTTGFDNVTELPAFYLWQLNNPLQQPGDLEKLKMMTKQPIVFKPGTDFLYSNTNYLVLKYLLENVSGKSYEELLREKILLPAGLHNTWFQLSATTVEGMPFGGAYFDRFGNSKLENVSRWNNALANASSSYGGIAATAQDVITFYESLSSLVSAPSYQQMFQWVQGKSSTGPEYGLGIEYFQFGPGSTSQWGHEGDGIGSSDMYLYIPANHTSMYININAGRQLGGPYVFKITDLKNELGRFLARQP